MSPRAHITTGIISVFIPHFLVVSISRSLYLESFSDGTAISMSLLVMFSWAYFTISGLLAAISLSVCICISQSIVTVFSLFLVTIAGSCSYHLSSSWML